MKRIRILLGLLGVAVLCVAAVMWRAHVALDDTPYNATHAQLAALEMKIQAFYLDTEALPKDLEGLLVSEGYSKWQGPYAKSRDLVDPWGRAIRYEALDPHKPFFRLSAVDAKGNTIIAVAYL